MNSDTNIARSDVPIHPEVEPDRTANDAEKDVSMECREVEGCRVGLAVDLLIGCFCRGGIHKKLQFSAFFLSACSFDFVVEDIKRA
jgi:hypothetical protein